MNQADAGHAAHTAGAGSALAPGVHTAARLAAMAVVATLVFRTAGQPGFGGEHIGQ